MLPSVTTSCSKFCAVTAVADKRSLLANNALQCPDPTFGSSEALLANCCGLNNTSNWQAGPHVMTDCSAIPKYTPVASFNQGVVQPDSEAIFIGCLTQPEIGIKIIRQNCTEAPSIVHVNMTQGGYPSPYNYFVIS